MNVISVERAMLNNGDETVNMPALKGSYDLKKLKRDQRNMRKSAREKQREKQKDFIERETHQTKF